MVSGVVEFHLWGVIDLFSLEILNLELSSTRQYYCLSYFDLRRACSVGATDAMTRLLLPLIKSLRRSVSYQSTKQRELVHGCFLIQGTGTFLFSDVPMLGLLWI
jgi:hypothetical protein